MVLFVYFPKSKDLNSHRRRFHVLSERDPSTVSIIHEVVQELSDPVRESAQADPVSASSHLIERAPNGSFDRL
jgi:hypothetical protein